MGRGREYEERTEKLLLPLLEENGFELVDVEYVKEGGTWILRAFIDKEGGITIDDCELVSRALSDLLDREDFIEESYVLEVSSPGLGRQLKKERDFARSVGEEVEVRLYRAVQAPGGKKGRKTKELRGRLEGFDEQTLLLSLGNGPLGEDDLEKDSHGKCSHGKRSHGEGEQISIPRSDIALVRLALDF